jgi:hypothetical protein
MGYRNSFEEPFGGFALIEALNIDGFSVDPYPASNGQRLYYRYRPDGVSDINNTGIYVSEWVDDSYTDAVRLLQEATDRKLQSLRLVQEASDKEYTAMQILEQVSIDEIPAKVSLKDIRQSIQLIRKALQKQRLVRQNLEVDIQYLNAAWFLLLPFMPAV